MVHRPKSVPHRLPKTVRLVPFISCVPFGCKGGVDSRWLTDFTLCLEPSAGGFTGGRICALHCKRCSVRTCLGCGGDIRNFVEVSLRVGEGLATVRCCTCQQGRMFMLWALCCGWYDRTPPSSDLKRHTRVLSWFSTKIRKPPVSHAAVIRTSGVGYSTRGNMEQLVRAATSKSVCSICYQRAPSWQLCVWWLLGYVETC